MMGEDPRPRKWVQRRPGRGPEPHLGGRPQRGPVREEEGPTGVVSEKETGNPPPKGTLRSVISPFLSFGPFFFSDVSSSESFSRPTTCQNKLVPKGLFGVAEVF